MIQDMDNSGHQLVLKELESDKNKIDGYTENATITNNCDENTGINEQQLDTSQSYDKIIIPQSQNDLCNSNVFDSNVDVIDSNVDVIDSNEDEEKSLYNLKKSVVNNINVRLCQVKIEKRVFHKCNRCSKAFLHVEDLTTHKKNHKERFLEHVFSSYMRLERLRLSDKMFVCSHYNCSQCFSSKQNLTLHQSVIHARPIKCRRNDDYSNKPYKCKQCDLRFVAETTLKAHAFVHEPYQHICYCGIGFYQQEDLKAHQILVQCTKPQTENIKPPHNIPNVEPPEKTVLDKVKFQSLMEERKTQRQKSGSKSIQKKKKLWKVQPSLQTEIDSMRQRTKLSRLDVEFLETSNKRFECPECKKDYHTIFTARLHYRSVHRGERPHSCKVCGKSFTQDSALTIHLWRHLEVKNFPCHYCEKSFYDLGALKLHERTHSGYKPYKCGICKKEFSDPSAFQRHMRIHTGDRKYKCPYCPNAFTDNSQLYVHKKRHENNRNILCNKCKKGFITKNERRIHISTVHNGVYNFPCNHCDKAFSSKFNLECHVLKMARRCDICDRESFCKRSAQMHFRTHYPVKTVSTKIACDFCRLQYSSKSHLWRHMLHSHASQKYVSLQTKIH